MARKKDNTAPAPAEAASVQPQTAEIQPTEPALPPVSNAQVLGFWGFLLLLAAAAWLLDYFMPSMPERVVERWLMLPMAGFMIYTLYRLRDR